MPRRQLRSGIMAWNMCAEGAQCMADLRLKYVRGDASPSRAFEPTPGMRRRPTVAAWVRRSQDREGDTRRRRVHAVNRVTAVYERSRLNARDPSRGRRLSYPALVSAWAAVIRIGRQPARRTFSVETVESDGSMSPWLRLRSVAKQITSTSRLV